MLVFLLSCFGIFDGISETVADKLYNTFGYTNEWTKSYGPKWFAESIRNIAALTSKEMVFIFTLFFYVYLQIIGRINTSKKLVFVMLIGFIILLVTKILTSKQHEISIESMILDNLSYFPSGHAFMATVFYLTITKLFHSDNSKSKLNLFLDGSAIILIGIIGVSLFMGSGHSVTEVIAGWSLGVCWFTFSQLFFRADYKKLTNK